MADLRTDLTSRVIDCSAAGTDTGTVTITVTVKGGAALHPTTITRVGDCISDLGRAIDRVYQKYDATTTGRKPKP